MLSDAEKGNFGEAHNDHAQILATTGIIGYALLVAAIVYLIRLSFLPSDPDERARFVRFASLPLAVAFAVSALGEFPLELAAPLSAYIFFSALCVAWSKLRALA